MRLEDFDWYSHVSHILSKSSKRTDVMCYVEHVVAWSMDFLCGRKQFVKLAVSSVSHITAGTPQGIVSGPNDFKLIINDLQFYIGYLKFVDDTTTFSVSNDPYNCLLQKAADYSCEYY